MNVRSGLGALALVVGIALVGAPTSGSAPPNSTSDRAQPVASLPATIAGDTHGTTSKEADPGLSCASTRGVLWYTVRAPHRGPLVARLVADDALDGALAVYRVIRSRTFEIACKRTDGHGRASLAWYGYRQGSYLLAVAQRARSDAGGFSLALQAAERPPRPPGAALPAGGIRTTIDPILDASDAWSVRMERGTTYRINLTTPSGCLSLALYRPRTYSFVSGKPVWVRACGGYAVFTPGIDGGGVYSLVVRAHGSEPVKHSYRVQVAAATADDTAPGVPLANGQSIAGSIFGRGIDSVDLYRFAVPRENELTTLSLAERPNVGLDLVVLDETGGRVACACEGRGPQVIRKTIPPGHYYAGVLSRERSGGKYRLQLLVRDVTTTRISAGGATYLETVPGAPVSLQVAVTSASRGGPVELEIDRYDPLTGWQFASVVSTRVDSSGLLVRTWTPPSVGHWRARARFVGTPFSSFSESGYVRVHVAEPLETALLPSP